MVDSRCKHVKRVSSQNGKFASGVLQSSSPFSKEQHWTKVEIQTVQKEFVAPQPILKEFSIYSHLFTSSATYLRYSIQGQHPRTRYSLFFIALRCFTMDIANYFGKLHAAFNQILIAK